MVQVHHVKKARKDKPKYGIKRGDAYYWWALRKGGVGVRKYSKRPPKASQLTASIYKSTFLQCAEAFSAVLQKEDLNYLQIIDICTQCMSVLATLGDAQLEAIERMPVHLEDSKVADLLRMRYDCCCNLCGKLEDLQGEAIFDLKADVSTLLQHACAIVWEGGM